VKTDDVITRVYVFCALYEIKNSKTFYRKSPNLSTLACLERERETKTTTNRVCEAYAEAMGITLEEFQQPLSEFLTTLKLRKEAYNAQEQ